MASMQTCPNQHIYSWRCCFTPHFQVFVHIFVCQCMNSTLYTLHTVSKGHLFRHEIHTTSSLTEDVVFCSGECHKQRGKYFSKFHEGFREYFTHKHLETEMFRLIALVGWEEESSWEWTQRQEMKCLDQTSRCWLVDYHTFFTRAGLFFVGDVWV